MVHESDAVSEQVQKAGITPKQLLALLETTLGTAGGKKSLAFLSIELSGEENATWTDESRPEIHRVSERLSGVLRPADAYSILSPGRIWVLLAQLPSKGVARIACQRIQQVLLRNQGQSAHMGCVVAVESNVRAKTMLELAETARREAAAVEDHLIVREVSSADNAEDLQAFVHQLKQAIQSNELSLHYQPQVTLATGRCHSVEALLRWFRPDGSSVSPVKVVETAERYGLIDAITRHIVRVAARHASELQQEGVPVRIAVNLAARSFSDPTFPDFIEQQLSMWNLDGNALMLEITERSIVNDFDGATKMISRLASHGIHFSIDDFGTGYSALAYLKRLKVNELKIDRAFVKDLPQDEGDMRLAQSIVNLSHVFGLSCVAEGIETLETARALRSMGCDLGQGWYFAKAMSVEQLRPWLAQHGPKKPN